jgi:hypothetical protein
VWAQLEEHSPRMRACKAVGGRCNSLIHCRGVKERTKETALARARTCSRTPKTPHSSTCGRGWLCAGTLTFSCSGPVLASPVRGAGGRGQGVSAPVFANTLGSLVAGVAEGSRASRRASPTTPPGRDESSAAVRTRPHSPASSRDGVSLWILGRRGPGLKCRLGVEASVVHMSCRFFKWL